MSAQRAFAGPMRAGAACVALALLPIAVAAQEIRYSGSVGYSRGDYIFTERTESFSLLNSLNLRWDRFSAYVSVPLVMQNSQAVTYLHGIPVPTGGPDNVAVRQRRSGEPIRMGRRGTGDGGTNVDSVLVTEPGSFEADLGDPMLSLSLELYRSDVLRSIEITGKVKAPLTDVESGFGSGEWDYAAAASVALAAGRALLFADAAWWWLGDMPDLELVDYLDYGLGVGVPLGESWSALASFAAATTIIDNVDPPMSLSAFLSRRLASGHSLNGGVSFGLSESAADVSISIGWGLQLLQRP